MTLALAEELNPELNKMKKQLFSIIMFAFAGLSITMTTAQTTTSKATTPTVATPTFVKAPPIVATAITPKEEIPKNNIEMTELLVNTFATIIGGLFITLILFLLNEYVFTKNNLTGEWKTTTEIETTTNNPFKDLKIEYKIHLIQKGYELSGSGEKIKDINPDGTETVFKREYRVNNQVDGYFERKYFGKSKVYLNINEEGRIRKTRSTYILTLNDKNILEGTFVSTAGDASGKVYMRRK